MQEMPEGTHLHVGGVQCRGLECIILGNVISCL